MSYENKVNEILKNPSERALIDLITSQIEVNDTNIKAK